MNEPDQDKIDFPAPPPLEGLPSALERLGASPFPKSGFPLLGFLATLYDQVSDHADDPYHRALDPHAGGADDDSQEPRG